VVPEHMFQHVLGHLQDSNPGCVLAEQAPDDKTRIYSGMTEVHLQDLLTLVDACRLDVSVACTQPLPEQPLPETGFLTGKGELSVSLVPAGAAVDNGAVVGLPVYDMQWPELSSLRLPKDDEENVKHMLSVVKSHDEPQNAQNYRLEAVGTTLVLHVDLAAGLDAKVLRLIAATANAAVYLMPYGLKIHVLRRLPTALNYRAVALPAGALPPPERRAREPVTHAQRVETILAGTASPPSKRARVVTDPVPVDSPNA
jgi:hypothetical protein